MLRLPSLYGFVPALLRINIEAEMMGVQGDADIQPGLSGEPFVDDGFIRRAILPSVKTCRMLAGLTALFPAIPTA
jgi:hypothetical protein